MVCNFCNDTDAEGEKITRVIMFDIGENIGGLRAIKQITKETKYMNYKTIMMNF